MSGDLIYGLHAVTTALKRGVGEVQELWVEAGRRDDRISQVLQLAEARGVTVHRTVRKDLDRLVEGAHQGVVARYQAPIFHGEAGLDQLLDGLQEAPFLLVLDGVQDPHNLGACLRTADAAGVHAVITPKDRAVGLTPVVRKVACGAAETVPFIQVTNLARTLRDLQSRGIWLVGADGDAEANLYQADMNGPLAVLMGAEGKGLRRLTKEHCDVLVAIPMSGSVESLNVSVATGIVLFEARRQRLIAVGP